MNDFQTRNMAEQIRQLELRVKKLEDYQEYRKHFLSLNQGEAVIRSYGGAAEIVLRKNGDISIKGRKVTIVGSSDVFVRSASDLILKGSKIGAN